MPQKVHCAVTQVIDHGERVYSVSLQPDSLAPRFRAGQFLHLALDPYTPGDFWPDSRIFSIASSPDDRSTVSITYAVKGQFTSRMESELQVGRQVWVKLPYGEFIINPNHDVCLLAGGTGITAFTAFLTGLQADYPHNVYLFYGARRPDLLIYRSLVESAAAKCSKLHPYFLAEQGEPDGFISGRISVEHIWQNLPNPEEMVYYLSGPPIMLKTLSAALTEHCIPSPQILTDAWE
jgi:ferredoxin-NADP reductase